MTQQQSNGTSVILQGRIIWTAGNLFSGNHLKDEKTKAPLYNQDGTPKVQYGFGLAIPKVLNGAHHPEYVKAYQALMGEALTMFPSGQVPPSFAMKYKDGDTDLKEDGTPYSTKEGYAGHIVIACTTFIPIKFFKHDGQQNVQVNDGIKNGDYVNVQLNIKSHPAQGQAKAGLYVNPSAVQFIQAGKEIINTPSGDQVFGMAAPAGYNGVVEAPTVPTMPNVAAPQMPAAQPHYGVLPPQHQAPVIPQAAPAPVMPPMPGMPR